ncbi:MAG: hypothetical protein WBA99_11125 [Nodosilinea sp.]
MNRFIIGGILAAVVAMLAGGLNRVLSDRADGSTEGARISSQSTRTEQGNGGDLGSVPLEQAGQLVQRQSDVGAGGPAAVGDNVFTDQGAGTGPAGQRAEISPGSAGTGAAAPGNVIPRTGGAVTFPATTGDIAPLQPGLVQPGVTPGPAPDPELDSIPALW